MVVIVCAASSPLFRNLSQIEFAGRLYKIDTVQPDCSLDRRDGHALHASRREKDIGREHVGVSLDVRCQLRRKRLECSSVSDVG